MLKRMPDWTLAAVARKTADVWPAVSSFIETSELGGRPGLTAAIAAGPFIGLYMISNETEIAGAMTSC